MKKCIVVALLFAAALTAGVFARPAPQATTQAPAAERQVPPLTFKVEVNYVEVDAIVTDERGGFVHDLAKNDFQVLEDGKPQEVATFNLVRIPVERADAPLFVPRPIEPDVATNVRQFDGRVYLIVLDDLHTSPMHTPRVRAAARRFIETQMGANDTAAVVSTRSRGAVQEFTSNRRLLTAAVDKFTGQSLASATLSRTADYDRIRNSPDPSQIPRDLDAQERAYNARSTLGVLRRLSDFMASVRGRRKALVFFSEGLDYDIVDVFNNPAAGDVRQETYDAIAAATRANVSIYSVDARGLVGVPGMEADFRGVPIEAEPSLRLGSDGMLDELRMSQDSLRVLSEETGGFAAINSNDFLTAFERIREDNSTYYVLGYYPSNDRRDGKFRRIEVRLNRPGLRVRARRGYVAPRGKAPAVEAVEAKEGTSPALRETLNSPVPMSGLGISAFAAPFKGVAPNASVLLVVQTSAGGLRFEERDGRFEGNLELSAIAIDGDGKVKDGVRQSVGMPLKPESYKVVSQHGIRVMSRMNLRPGKYQLRIAALDKGSGQTGSVHYDLEVPDFSEPALAMSGLVITSSLAGATPTPGGAEDEVRKLMPGPPTTLRSFRSSEQLALLAEIYDNRAATPHGVDIITTLRSDDGREMFRQAEERSSSEIQGSAGGYGYSVSVPLQGLAPGLYLLRVEGRSRLSGGATTAREVQIRIVQ